MDYQDASCVTDVAEVWSDSIVEDGSLPDAGFEINTNPTNGDRFIEHVTELCSGLNRASATVERCCGMHVHCDATDYSYYDLFKLTRIYALVEDALFSLCAPSRRNGQYSRVCGESYSFDNYQTFKKDLMARMYGTDCAIPYKSWDGKLKPSTTFSRARKRQTLSCFTERYNSNRYTALNLHSFFYRRTVEFRHHQGTTQASKATSWAMVCGAVMDSAARMTEKQISALPHDSFEALLVVTPTSLHDWMLARRAALGR
jgi:hypothetical protein